MVMEFSSKTALVTGGAHGIGRAVVLRLARDGANVAVADRDLPAARRVSHDVEALGRACLPLQVEVANSQQVVAAVNTVVAHFGIIDILVNCAGILGPCRPTWEMADDEWDELIAIHLRGTFLFCKAVVKHMLERQRGKIVSLSSVSGKEGNSGYSAYSAAKAGVIALTKSLAKEVATAGIQVNCISPALIVTRFFEEMSRDQREKLLQKIPMGRAGTPDEVAALVKFLVSEEANFITGQCYDISGGRSVY